MQVEIKGNTVVITLPIEENVSKSGKSLVIGSSGGNKATTAIYNGKPIYVGVNAYITRTR